MLFAKIYVTSSKVRKERCVCFHEIFAILTVRHIFSLARLVNTFFWFFNFQNMIKVFQLSVNLTNFYIKPMSFFP